MGLEASPCVFLSLSLSCFRLILSFFSGVSLKHVPREGAALKIDLLQKFGALSSGFSDSLSEEPKNNFQLKLFIEVFESFNPRGNASKILKVIFLNHFYSCVR